MVFENLEMTQTKRVIDDCLIFWVLYLHFSLSFALASVFLKHFFLVRTLWYSCSVLSFFLLSFIVSSILFLFFFCSFLWFLLILFLFFLTFYCFYSCFSSLLFYMLLLFPFSLALVLLSKCKMDKNGHLSVTVSIPKWVQITMLY